MMDLPFHHPAWIEVDLVQFRKNIELIRKQTYGSLLCLPVKANAYGHGLIPIAHAAVKAQVDYLAVSCLQEGAQLREAGIGLPILVMGAIHEEQIRKLIEYNLELTISSAYKASMVAKVCESHDLKCRIHIELDTGMQRTGMRPETALELIKHLSDNKKFEIVGIYSHLANSENENDVSTLHQIKIFNEFKHKISRLIRQKIIYHLCNSGGVCHYPEAYFDMVRPGILAFGHYLGKCTIAFSEVQPFFSLKAKIAFFKVVERDVGISYGHHYKTKERTRIVTIPIGYGDGFRRSLSHRGHVLIRSKRYPIAGTICMDQFMVDIGQDEAYVGEEAVIIGRQNENEIPLNEIAHLCDTIPYEILCSFNQRLPRFYIE